MEDNIIIMNKKFELFLNTVHYCLWLGDRKFGDFMGKVVNVLLSPIPKYLFTKEYKKKLLYEAYTQMNEEI